MVDFFALIPSKGGILVVKGVLLTTIMVAGTLFGSLPVHDFWFWSTIYLLAYRNLITSLISGMPEPDQNSTPGYIWAHRSLHAMDRRISPYRFHKSFWKVFEMAEDKEKPE